MNEKIKKNNLEGFGHGLTLIYFHQGITYSKASLHLEKQHSQGFNI